MLNYKKFVAKYFPVALQAHILTVRSRRREKAFGYLPPYIARDRNSIDIGANRGIYTRFLAKRTRHVYAYEPNAAMEPYLRAGMPSNVSVKMIALSDHEGQEDLFIPIGRDGRDLISVAKLGDDFGDEEYRGRVRHVPVPVKTLDSENLENVGFIKIDVEGFEWDVIRGGEALIARDRPVIFCEVEQRHLSFPVDDFFTYMQNLGYRPVFFDDAGLHEIAEFSVERHQNRTPPANDVAPRPYINNFLFIPQNVS